MIRRLLLALLFAAALPLRAQEWETATPESQGMDSAALARLVEYGGNVRMDSLVVLRHGRIVAEAYYAPYRREMLHPVNSTTKAVIGALAGIAIARGELPPPDTPVAQLLPGAPWPQMKLQHLLDMRSGLEWNEPLSDVPVTFNEMRRSIDWQNFLFARKQARPPGQAFHYNSGNPHLVAIALKKRTGMGVERYAEQHLFGPLGITRYQWVKDPQDVASGGAGLSMHTRDMARFGQLYLQRGQWAGRQVIAREWVDRVFSPAVAMDFPGYMYADYWWSIPRRNAFFTSGFNRQVIMVLPQLDAVVAVTGRGGYPFEDLIAHIERAAASTAALPANDAAAAALREQVATAARGKALPGEADHAAVAPGTWRLDDNAAGIREFTLDLTAAPPRYHVKLRSHEFAGTIGVGGAFGAGTDNGRAVYTSMRWVARDTIEFDQRWPEDGRATTYRLRFAGERVDFTPIDMFGVRGTVRGTRVQ